MQISIFAAYSRILINIDFFAKILERKKHGNHISAFDYYKLTKSVPNKSSEIAFLFIIHICKSAYIQCHVHEYSFNNTFFFLENP